MKRLALGLGLLLIGVGWAVTQPVTNLAPSGSECWNAGQGPGGPSNWLCINPTRNGTAAETTSGSGAATFTATNETGTVIWTGTAPTTWAVTLPCVPRPGALITLSTATTLTTMVTVTAASGCTMETAYTSQTLTDNVSIAFQLIGTVWFRIR